MEPVYCNFHLEKVPVSQLLESLLQLMISTLWTQYLQYIKISLFLFFLISHMLYHPIQLVFILSDLSFLSVVCFFNWKKVHTLQLMYVFLRPFFISKCLVHVFIVSSDFLLNQLITLSHSLYLADCIPTVLLHKSIWSSYFPWINT